MKKFNFEHYVHEIKKCKAEVTPQLFYDFCIDYGYAVVNELKAPHKIKGRVNPYVMEQAEVMMKLITHSVKREYWTFDTSINLDNIIKRLDPAEVARTQFQPGTASKLLKLLEESDDGLG